jgi:ABC-2 type transport system ATP-binding protein
LLGQDVIRSVEVVGETLHVQTDDLGNLGRLLPSLALSLDVRLTMVQPEDLSLESVFRYLVHGK